MAYSSSLTDLEWEIFEPLLVEILPKKKETRRPDWSNRDILDGIFYQLKKGVIGKTCRKMCRLLGRFTGTTNNGANNGAKLGQLKN